MGFRVEDLGFGVWGLGSQFSFKILVRRDLRMGFRVWDLGFGIWGLGFGVSDQRIWSKMFDRRLRV